MKIKTVASLFLLLISLDSFSSSLRESFKRAVEQASDKQLKDSISKYDAKIDYIKNKDQIIEDYHNSFAANLSKQVIDNSYHEIFKNIDEVNAKVNNAFWAMDDDASEGCSKYYSLYRLYSKRFMDTLGLHLGYEIAKKERTLTKKEIKLAFIAKARLEMLIGLFSEYAFLLNYDQEVSSGIFGLGQSKCEMKNRNLIKISNAQLLMSLEKLRLNLFGHKIPEDYRKVNIEANDIKKSERTKNITKIVGIGAVSIVMTFSVGPWVIPYLMSTIPQAVVLTSSLSIGYAGLSGAQIGKDIYQAKMKSSTVGIQNTFELITQQMEVLIDPDINVAILSQYYDAFTSAQIESFKNAAPEVVASQWLDEAVIKYEGIDNVLEVLEARRDYVYEHLNN